MEWVCAVHLMNAGHLRGPFGQQCVGNMEQFFLFENVGDLLDMWNESLADPLFLLEAGGDLRSE